MKVKTLQLSGYPQPATNRWIAYCTQCDWAKQYDDIEDKAHANMRHDIVWLSAQVTRKGV